MEVTEGYVEAQAKRVKAETQTDIANALLRLEKSAKADLLWTIGFIVGMVGIATAVILAVLG